MYLLMYFSRAYIEPNFVLQSLDMLISELYMHYLCIAEKSLTLSLSSSSTKTPHPDTSHKIRCLQLVLFTKTKTSATQMRIFIYLSLLWRILESYHTIMTKCRFTEHVLEDTFILYCFQKMITNF